MRYLILFQSKVKAFNFASRVHECSAFENIDLKIFLEMLKLILCIL